MYKHLIDMFEKRYYKLDETYKKMLLESGDDNIKAKIKELIEYQETKRKENYMFDYDTWLSTVPEEEIGIDEDEMLDDAYDRYIDEQLGIL